MNSGILRGEKQTAHIFLVEDNPGDVILTKRAFKDSEIANKITVATTGEEAIEILRKEGAHANAETPDLVLLDLNLPKMGGQDVLKVIKNSDGLRRIPIIVLSSSVAEQDVVKSYDLHANAYVVKQIDLEKFKEVIHKLEDFWFSIAVLPR